MPKIIISYRRAQNDAVAGRIRDRLVAHYGADAVFMDVDNIPFGTDFRKHIDAALNEGDVVVAVIGPKWTGPQKGKKARILDETDPVRVEIETAIKRGITVLPILVDGATMPKPAELPEPIRDLAYANAASVDTGRDFHQHMDRVMRSMDALLKTAPAPAPRSIRRRWGLAAAGLAALLAVAGGVWTFVPPVRDAILGAPTVLLPDIVYVQPNPATMGEAPPPGPGMDTLPGEVAETPQVARANGDALPANGDGGSASATMTAAPPDGEARRVALVIANAAYEGAPALATAENDARVVAEAFNKIGFNVTSRTNLSREGLVTALHQFAGEATGAASAAFYYSGYGIQLNDINYLVPVDATLLTDRDVPFEAVPFDRVQDALSGANEPRIVMVDAAHGNPFESKLTRGLGTRSATLGLARVDAGQGEFVAFSAAPGQVGVDGNGETSAFAAALARRVTEPGTAVETVFRQIRQDVADATDGRQIPWDSSSLTIDVALAGQAGVATADLPPPGETMVKATVGGTFRLCGFADFSVSIMPATGDESGPAVVVQREGLANALGAKRLIQGAAAEIVEGCRVTLLETHGAPSSGVTLLETMRQTSVK